jgi:hypothetical protein
MDTPNLVLAEGRIQSRARNLRPQGEASIRWHKPAWQTKGTQRVTECEGQGIPRSGF